MMRTKSRYYNVKDVGFVKFKNKPYPTSNYVEINEWHGLNPKQHLWIKIKYYDNYVILDSTQILELGKEITKIQR